MAYTKIQLIILIILFCIEIMWIQFSSLTVHSGNEYIVAHISVSAFMFLLYIIYEKFRPVPEIVPLLYASFLLFSYSPLMLVFSYLANTANQPLIDSYLAMADEYLGIYSPSIVFWFRNQEWLYTIFKLIYYTFFYQFLFAILYFSFFGKIVSLQRLMMLFMIATPIPILISGFFPAAGPFVWYHYNPNPILLSALNHFEELRHNTLNLAKADGIVMFPSYHTVMALVFAYCFRKESKIIFIPISILNILMIFSCIPIGEHYFIDILGAVPVFLAVIGIEQLMYRVLGMNELTRAEVKNRTFKISL